MTSTDIVSAPYSAYKARKEKIDGVSVLTCTSKMPCPSWSLPAGKSCPNAHGGICASCYACKGMYMLPEVVHAQAVRFAWTIEAMRTEEGRKAWVAKIVKAIRTADVKWFRVHDAGDFFSMAYLECWIEVVKLLPDVRFWFPTREYQSKSSTPLLPILNPRLDGLRRLHALPNVTVRPSALEVGDAAPVIAGLGAGSTVDGPGKQCYAWKRDGHCGQCRHCWIHADVPVTYPLH